MSKSVERRLAHQRFKPIDTLGKCPKCGVSWDGELIPEDIRHHYPPPYHWSRVIGIEDTMIYDGIMWWKCPDCKEIFKRFPWSPDLRK